MLIRAKAPLRMSFAGGGTDVPPYSTERGGLVISSTINRYVYGTLRPRADKGLHVASLDYSSELSFTTDDVPSYDGNMDLVKATVRLLGVNRGCDLFLHSDALPGSGLGSSSALVVALVGLFRHWLSLPMTDYEMAELAFRIEREEVGIKGGKQDQYAATFGGFNLIEFTKDYTLVSPLRMKADVVNELEYRLLLCHTGVQRVSSGIIDDQVSNYEQRKAAAVEALDATKELALEMKRAILMGQVDEVGYLLDVAWQHKQKFSSKISNPKVERLYELGKANGAVGGKLLGAGGGGCLLFLCEFARKHVVAEKLEKEGGHVLPFGFVHTGL